MSVFSSWWETLLYSYLLEFLPDAAWLFLISKSPNSRKITHRPEMGQVELSVYPNDNDEEMGSNSLRVGVVSQDAKTTFSATHNVRCVTHRFFRPQWQMKMFPLQKADFSLLLASILGLFSALEVHRANLLLFSHDVVWKQLSNPPLNLFSPRLNSPGSFNTSWLDMILSPFVILVTLLWIGSSLSLKNWHPELKPYMFQMWIACRAKSRTKQAPDTTHTCTRTLWAGHCQHSPSLQFFSGVSKCSIHVRFAVI